MRTTAKRNPGLDMTTDRDENNRRIFNMALKDSDFIPHLQVIISTKQSNLPLFLDFSVATFLSKHSCSHLAMKGGSDE